MTYRPKIGLTMRLDVATGRFYLARDYSEALAVAGASPLHLSLIPDRDYIDDVVGTLDGVLLPGSDSDMDPAYYGEDPLPKLGRVVPEKDETDLMVLDAAERLELPVFAICFGMQSLNVSRGGSLIQDIGSQVENCLKHEQGEPRSRNSHYINLENDANFGATLSGDERRIKVNSHHHQAIRIIGRDLAVAARSGDQVIEAVTDTRKGRFVVGVQWHPELSWASDQISKVLFKNFVESCGLRKFEKSRHKTLQQMA